MGAETLDRAVAVAVAVEEVGVSDAYHKLEIRGRPFRWVSLRAVELA